MINLIPFVVFIALWYAIAKFYKNKGKKAFIRHLAGFAVGGLGLIISIIAIMPSSVSTSPNTASVQNSANEQKNKVEPKQTVETAKTVEQKVENTEPTQPANQTQQEKPIKAEPEKAELKEEKAAKVKVATLTIAQFAKQVNANLVKSGSDYRLPMELKIAEGDVNNTAQYMFSDTLGVTLVLDKQTNNIKSLMTAVGVSDDGNQTLKDLMFHAAVIAAFDGQNGMKTVGGRYIKITTQAVDEFRQSGSTQKSFILNGKKYGISMIKGVGIVGYAEPNTK